MYNFSITNEDIVINERKLLLFKNKNTQKKDNNIFIAERLLNKIICYR